MYRVKTAYQDGITHTSGPFSELKTAEKAIVSALTAGARSANIIPGGLETPEEWARMLEGLIVEGMDPFVTRCLNDCAADLRGEL